MRSETSSGPISNLIRICEMRHVRPVVRAYRTSRSAWQRHVGRQHSFESAITVPNREVCDDLRSQTMRRAGARRGIALACGRRTAQVPAAWSYQGFLTDNTGVPLTGTYTFQFIFSRDSTSFVAEWADTVAVTVENGYFTTFVGKQKDPIPCPEPTPFGPALCSPWMEVVVEGETLGARRRLGALR